MDGATLTRPANLKVVLLEGHSPKLLDATTWETACAAQRLDHVLGIYRLRHSKKQIWWQWKEVSYPGPAHG